MTVKTLKIHDKLHTQNSPKFCPLLTKILARKINQKIKAEFQLRIFVRKGQNLANFQTYFPYFSNFQIRLIFTLYFGQPLRGVKNDPQNDQFWTQNLTFDVKWLSKP